MQQHCWHPVSQRLGCCHQRQFRQAHSQPFRLCPVSQQLLCVLMARAYSAKALLPFLSPAPWSAEGTQPLSKAEEQLQADCKRCPVTQSISLPPALFAAHICTCAHTPRNKSRVFISQGCCVCEQLVKIEECGVL